MTLVITLYMEMFFIEMVKRRLYLLLISLLLLLLSCLYDMCVGKKNNHEIACWIIIASVLVVTVVDFSNSSRAKMACQNLFSFSPYYLYE